MGNKKKKGDGRGSTIENRVYLFKDLAAAWLDAHGAALSSSNAAERQRALRALGDIAHASCVVADTEDRSPDEVADQVAKGPPTATVTTTRGSASKARRTPKKARRTTKKAPRKRRGWGGGRGGG